jgi:hypothetical protein
MVNGEWCTVAEGVNGYIDANSAVFVTEFQNNAFFVRSGHVLVPGAAAGWSEWCVEAI